MSLRLLRNFKLDGEVLDRSVPISSFNFKLFRTEETVEAKLLFFDNESLLNLFFKLTLVNLFFYSLIAVVNFCVAENFLVFDYYIIYLD